jgi:hypothetical protein
MPDSLLRTANERKSKESDEIFWAKNALASSDNDGSTSSGRTEKTPKTKQKALETKGTR